jgi:hypothetical protein
MLNLEDMVRSVVQDFIDRDVLFTALDVSNEVKKVLPLSRHREIRDVVRGLFVSDIESQGWARTPITVSLANGSTAEALLYHSLVDSWDLDNRYDAQKRTQVPSRPVAQVSASNDEDISLSATLAAGFVSVSAPQVMPAPKVDPMPTARTLWDNMFQTQPSLFPRK